MNPIGYHKSVVSKESVDYNFSPPWSRDFLSSVNR